MIIYKQIKYLLSKFILEFKSLSKLSYDTKIILSFYEYFMGYYIFTENTISNHINDIFFSDYVTGSISYDNISYCITVMSTVGLVL